MFLDDELSKIHEENGFSCETSKKLVDACLNRVAKPLEGTNAFLNSLRRIDASWRLFCVKYEEYDKDGFRKVILMLSGEMSDVFKKALHW